MEAWSLSLPAALSPEDVSDHFAELAATLDNDAFAIYAELATAAAAFPAVHQAAMAALPTSSTLSRYSSSIACNGAWWRPSRRSIQKTIKVT